MLYQMSLYSVYSGCYQRGINQIGRWAILRFLQQRLGVILNLLVSPLHLRGDCVDTLGEITVGVSRPLQTVISAAVPVADRVVAIPSQDLFVAHVDAYGRPAASLLSDRQYPQGPHVGGNLSILRQGQVQRLASISFTRYLGSHIFSSIVIKW